MEVGKMRLAHPVNPEHFNVADHDVADFGLGKALVVSEFPVIVQRVRRFGLAGHHNAIAVGFGKARDRGMRGTAGRPDGDDRRGIHREEFFERGTE